MLLVQPLSVIWFPSANLFCSNSQYLNTRKILATETTEAIAQQCLAICIFISN